MTIFSLVSGFRSDFPAYFQYVLTTFRFVTLGTWRRAGRPMAFSRHDYRADIVTRSQIVNLFFAES